MSSAERFLLDTVFLSETFKPRMNPGVRSFLSENAGAEMFVSVLSLGEIWKGIAKKRQKDDAGAKLLEMWANQMESTYAGRVLSVDLESAHLWGEWSAGPTRPVIDTLLAATAVRHGLTLVTRNTADMAGLPVRIINPWIA